MSGGVFSVDILTKLKLVQFTPTNSKIYICMILTDFLAFLVQNLWPKNKTGNFSYTQWKKFHLA